jgi:hypothetical protein
VTDDVRAAAERITRSVHEAVYTGPLSLQGKLADALIVADAVLAEYPADDGDPLTPERLKAFGFTAVENQWGGLALRVKGRARLGYSATRPVGRRWVAWDDDENDGGGIYVPDPQTVGGLRRLAIALGIHLEEPQ